MNYKLLFIPLTLFLLIVAVSKLKATTAYFTDTISISGNTFTMGVWTTPTPGDVVINELMWMGSLRDSDNDEWIELKNTTDHNLNISDWQLTRLISSETLMVTLPQNSTISAHGYFLISRLYNIDNNSILDITPDFVSSSVVLRNTNLQIKLYKGNWQDNGNLIDTADDGIGTPLAGNNSPKKSMERNSTPGDGTTISNWHNATNQTNFKSGSTELATPKSNNSLP